MKNGNDYPDFDKEIRHLIEFETQLVDVRMKWLILAQSLLFAGFCTICDKDDMCAVSIVIAIVGVLLAIIIRHSFWLNEKAIAFILSKWNKYREVNNIDCDDVPPVWAGGDLQSVLQTKSDKRWAKSSPLLRHYQSMPYLFAIAWIAIIIIYL